MTALPGDQAAQLLPEYHDGGWLHLNATGHQRMAEAIAEPLPETDKADDIVAFLGARLGDDYPLVRTLRKGVGYHHAALPIEALERLDGAGELGHPRA